MNDNTSNIKSKSTRHRVREQVETDLTMAKGKKTNISSPGYRVVQFLADHLDNNATPATGVPALKDPKSIRSGVNRDMEIAFILRAALNVHEQNRARAELAH